MMNEGRYHPVNVGVIGLGRFGKVHAKTLVGLTEANLTAIVDRDGRVLEGLEGELAPIPKWEDLSDALQRAEVEAWVVATRPDSHIRLAEEILAAGRHVLIEKPLAPSLEEASRLRSILGPSSPVVMMGHTMLFAPEIRQLMREVESRGRLIYFHSFRHRPASLWHPGRDSPLRELMVHDLYLAYALVRGEEPVRFSARIHPREGGGSDLALAHLEWENGTWGSLTASFITPAGMSEEGYDRLELFGLGWSAHVSLVPQGLEIWSDRAEWPIALNIVADPESPSGWLAEELRLFCRAVRGRAEIPFGARYEDALRVMEWLERLEAGSV
jgi:predicted dehydrogenase